MLAMCAVAILIIYSMLYFLINFILDKRRETGRTILIRISENEIAFRIV